MEVFTVWMGRFNASKTSNTLHCLSKHHLGCQYQLTNKTISSLIITTIFKNTKYTAEPLMATPFTSQRYCVKTILFYVTATAPNGLDGQTHKVNQTLRQKMFQSVPPASTASRGATLTLRWHRAGGTGWQECPCQQTDPAY